MEDYAHYCWFVVAAACVVALIEMLRNAVRKYPCFWRGHDVRYVFMSDTAFWTNGHCPRPEHRIHTAIHKGQTKTLHCYVAKWICTRCPEMGMQCIGDVSQGAWKVEHGKLFTDEKAWGSIFLRKDRFADE